MALPGSPAAVAITLDTTPPAISWGRIPPVHPSHDLVVPYSLDEQGIRQAIIVDAEGESHAMEVSDSELRFPMNKYFSPGHTEVRVVAEDEVGNAALYVMPLQVYNARFPLGVVVEQGEGWVELRPPEGDVAVSGRGEWDA